MNQKILTLALVAALFACRRDGVRGLDAHPEVPASIDFGVIAVDQVKAIPIRISNSGQIDLTVQDLQIEEPFDVDVPPDPVGPGGTQDVLVKFQPVQPGDLSGVLTLQTSSVEAPLIQVSLHGIAYQPQLDVAPDRLDFGQVTVGTQKTLTFDVTNNSPVALNVDVEPSDGPSDFTVSPQGLLGRLQPRQGATVTVSFTPSIAGAASSAVLLDCPVCSVKQVQINGTGVAVAGPAPICTLTPTPDHVDFGTLSLGQTGRQTISVASSGTGSCFVQKPYLDPSSDAALSAGPLEGGELKPSSAMTFTATFTPTKDTATQVSGSIVLVSNDKEHPALSIPLTAAFTPPPPPPPPPGPGHLVVAPPTLSFAAQAPAAPAAQTLSLLNDGGTALTWTVACSDPAVTVAAASGSLAASGGTSSVAVSVAAQAAAGSRSATLTFTPSQGAPSLVQVSIEFTAAPPPPPPPGQLAVTPLLLSFKTDAGTVPAAQDVAISNVGGEPLAWSATADDAAVSFTPASNASLAAAATQVMRVSVATSAFAGKRSASLVINAGAAGSKTVAISIEFTEPPPPPPPPQYGDSAWPKWHHDNRSSGLSHVDTSANKGTLKWKAFVSAPVSCITDTRTDSKTRCGTYVSSPVLDADGNVIQLGGDGNLYLFDRVTGKTLHSAPTAPPWISANEGTPTVVKDGSIFLMTAGESTSKDQFYKITQDWAVDKHLRSPGGDGWDSSPALDDDGTLYLANDDQGTVDAFDQRGVLSGQVTLSPQSDVETQSAALADGIGYWSANGHLWALTPSKFLWSFTDPVAARQQDWPARFLHNIKSSPALTPDGKVIYTYVFETTKNGKTMQTTRIYAFQAGTRLKPLWSASLGPTAPRPGLTPGGGLPADYADSLHYRSGITSPAVGPGGDIYVGHCDGLYAFASDTGKPRWGVGMAEVVSSPAVGKDGTIYVGSSDGKLHVIDPAGNEKWSKKTRGQLNSSPAIGADGTIYAMSDDGYLYAWH